LSIRQYRGITPVVHVYEKNTAEELVLFTRVSKRLLIAESLSSVCFEQLESNGYVWPLSSAPRMWIKPVETFIAQDVTNDACNTNNSELIDMTKNTDCNDKRTNSAFFVELLNREFETAEKLKSLYSKSWKKEYEIISAGGDRIPMYAFHYPNGRAAPNVERSGLHIFFVFLMQILL
jgi:hypothetical protein